MWIYDHFWTLPLTLCRWAVYDILSLDRGRHSVFPRQCSRALP